ncbi:MAG: hypothetical protein Q4E50_02345 [Tissierellia bacterium]|nr:hypothetical protein [Tissierellia bacterium]
MKNKKETTRVENQAKFIMSGLTIVMMATLFIYYLGAVIRDRYLVSFSFDSIVGVLAFIIMIKNFSIKYKLLAKCEVKKEFILIDLTSLLLCILIKVSFNLAFDLSLPILVIAYFASKKKFEKFLN